MSEPTQALAQSRASSLLTCATAGPMRMAVLTKAQASARILNCFAIPTSLPSGTPAIVKSRYAPSAISVASDLRRHRHIRAGTGCLAVFSNGQWRRLDDDSIVAV
jgi:hypothetical protein